MKFNITHDGETYIVDDLVAFGMQSSEFQELFNTVQKEDSDRCQTVKLDSATVMVFNGNRVIVTLNNTDDNENI